MTTTTQWEEALSHEAAWWGTCRNTFAEEVKQVHYAKRMDLKMIWEATFPSWQAPSTSIVDIGGGPVSMLLKTYGAKRSVVVDPCDYPSWVIDRYEAAGIQYIRARGEDLPAEKFGEAWIYNVLEHVEDAALVIDNARKVAKIVRVFEWVDTPMDGHHEHMHPTKLNAKLLDGWLGGAGMVEPGLKIIQHTNELPGTAYYGVFAGEG